MNVCVHVCNGVKEQDEGAGIGDVAHTPLRFSFCHFSTEFPNLECMKSILFAVKMIIQAAEADVYALNCSISFCQNCCEFYWDFFYTKWCIIPK